MMTLTFSFTSTVLAVVQILIMGSCGYFLVKRQLIDSAGLDLLARLLIDFFLPLFMFYNITQNFHFGDFPRWWIFPFLGMGINLICLGIGWILKGGLSEPKRGKDFTALVGFQNSGYIPMILVGFLLPPDQAGIVFVYIFLFLMGFNFIIWSLGFWLISKEGKTSFDWKNVVNLPLVAMVLALIAVAFGLGNKIPTTILSPMDAFGKCTLPMAMLVIGGNLASIRAGVMAKRDLAYFLFIKMLIIPVIGLAIVYFFHMKGLVGFLILLECIVPTAVTLSIIARHCDREAPYVNQSIFYSHLVAMVTMPLFLIVFKYIVENL